jgi:hypothetical protein
MREWWWRWRLEGPEKVVVMISSLMKEMVEKESSSKKKSLFLLIFIFDFVFGFDFDFDFGCWWNGGGDH